MLRGIPRSNRGSAVVVALGVLTLLAIFSVSFALLMGLERDASSNYSEQVRARLLTEAGLEQAYAELRSLRMDEPRKPAWQFGSRRGTPLTSPACKNPSYGMPTPHPGRTPEDVRGYSGVLGGTFAEDGDLYSLKILDTASMLHINDVNPRRPLVLRILLTALEIPDAAAIARAIESSRPRGGYTNKRQLRGLIGSRLPDDRTWHLIADHVTCYGYIPPRSRRAPINLNTAPEALLIAITAAVGRSGSGTPGPISFGDARRFVRKRFLPRRKEQVFAHWEDFRTWLASSGWPVSKRDALLDAWRPIEDGEAAEGAEQTPVTFLPHGFFEVTSAGIVYGPKDRVLAEQVRTTLVRVRARPSGDDR